MSFIRISVRINLIDKFFSSIIREIKYRRYSNYLLFSSCYSTISRVPDSNLVRNEKKGRHYLWISSLAPECLASGSTLADRIDDSYRHSRRYDSTCAIRIQSVPETNKINEERFSNYFLNNDYLLKNYLIKYVGFYFFLEKI